MAYAATVLADSPAAYFRLGESSGTAAVDQIGGASGTYRGGFTLGQAGLQQGDIDAAVRLNGTTGTIQVADRAAFDVADVFSIEAWIRLSALGAFQCIVDKGTNGYLFEVNTSNHVYLRKNGVADIVTATNALTTGVTYHVAATKSAATVKLYVNGADVTGTATNQTIANNSIALGIGAADAGTDDWLNGIVDEVAIYPTALSAARILAHYNAGLAATTHPVTLSTSQTQTARSSRGVARLMARAQAQSPGVGKAIGRGLAAAQGQAGIATRLAARALAASQSATPSSARGVGRTLRSTQTQAPTTSRSASRSLVASRSQAGSATRASARGLAATQAQAATGIGIRARIIVLSAVQTSTVRVGRGAARTLSAAHASAATVRKAATRTLSAAQAAVARAGKATGRTFHVTQPATASTTRALSRSLNTSTSSTPTVHGARGTISRTLLASVVQAPALTFQAFVVAHPRLAGLVRPFMRLGRSSPSSRTGNSNPSSRDGEV